MSTAMRMDLDAPLRVLVERRLDGIDRVLLAAGVSRGERCGIVEEVEAQIYEMLARRTEESPTRQDMLAVLAALDPPEAYAPEGYRAAAAAALAADRPAGPQPSLLALGSAAVGAINLMLLALCGLLAVGEELEGELLMLGLGVLGFCVPLAVTVCGAVSLLQIRASAGRLFGLPAAVFAAILFPMLLLNAVVGFSLMLLGEYALLLICGFAVVSGNVWLVCRVWRLLASGLRFPEPTAGQR
jgi:hypothetical protein